MEFIYTDTPETKNNQLREEFKKVVDKENIKMADIAKQLEMKPQQLNNKFLVNTKFSLYDLKRILNTIDYDLVLEFKKRK